MPAADRELGVAPERLHPVVVDSELLLQVERARAPASLMTSSRRSIVSKRALAVVALDDRLTCL
jgi:hypothetical protein